MEEGSSALEPMLETLRSRGWCFRDLDQVKATIIVQSALADDTVTIADGVESELSNLDLKSIGGKSLPDILTLHKSSYLPGPKVLQISSVKDISRSTIEDFSTGSGSRRLLRFRLTDGHTEITAIEFFNIPSISDDIVPGTKVRLENKAVLCSGIVCLSPKVITVVGGIVPSLYEEWKMNCKYSGFSRSSLRLSQESDGTGPPPFEKFQIGAPQNRFVQQGVYGSDFNSSRPAAAERNIDYRAMERQQDDLNFRESHMDGKLNSSSSTNKTEEKPSSSQTRPKEIIEFVPVQNQAATQKLLQKMSEQNQNDRQFKGRRNRGKERQNEQAVFTLDEWEERKAGAKTFKGDKIPDTSDEDLARQLQNQFNLEDSHERNVDHDEGAEDIRMSMFNYRRDDGSDYVGRGRGRGRGSMRGRGRGRGRGRVRGRGRGRGR